MSNKKVNLGQYFTKSIVWMQPQIIEFIKNTNINSVLDPFAGNGDLLKASNILEIEDVMGFDIDKKLGWKINDGLLYIPPTGRLIITNPPYLAKNSAKRKELDSYKYFNDTKYVDLYQIALEKCLETHDYIVAIIPETFLLSNLFTERLYSVTVLEDNPFEDTDCPVCVVCFTNEKVDKPLVYKNDEFIGDLNSLKNKVLEPINTTTMTFNDKNGNFGIRGVDGTSKGDKIRFCLPEDLDYDLNKICVSSRAITVVNLDGYSKEQILKIIDNANKILKEYRSETSDIFLAPFKGNNKDGIRRRRLDFKTARAIIERSVANV